jgi:hypothetical protein
MNNPNTLVNIKTNSTPCLGTKNIMVYDSMEGKVSMPFLTWRWRHNSITHMYQELNPDHSVHSLSLYWLSYLAYDKYFHNPKLHETSKHHVWHYTTTNSVWILKFEIIWNMTADWTEKPRRMVMKFCHHHFTCWRWLSSGL